VPTMPLFRNYDIREYVRLRVERGVTGIAMASWFVMCRNCGVPFVHSKVTDDSTLAALYFPLKPELPTGGQTLECPACGNTAAYQQSNLTYRA